MCQTASDVAHKMVDFNFGDIEKVILIHDDLIIRGNDFLSEARFEPKLQQLVPLRIL